MNTLRACTHLANDLVRLGALGARKLGELPLRDGSVPRPWVDSFAAEAHRILQDARRSISGLTEVADEGGGRALLESIDALLEAFHAPSLSTTAPTPAASMLLLHRTVVFLASGLRAVAGIALALGHDELGERCRYLAKRLGPAERRPLPYASPGAYRKHLQVFAELSAGPDPLAQLVVPTGDLSITSKTSRGPVSTERSRPPTYGGDTIALEISVPVLKDALRGDAEAPTDRTLRVWYGTNRAPVQPMDPARGFSASVDTKLHLGSCLVFVPRSHEEGSLGSSWVRRTFVLRADDRLRVESIRALDRDVFQQRFAAEMDRRAEARSALVFVHGFNVTFQEAALRAAQLACDLTVDGVTAFYSWPSVGSVRDYAHDEEAIRVTTPRFLEFLDTLLEVSSLDRVDIVAHSMGNRLVAAAMEKLASSPNRRRIGHLVLAAADVARIEFAPLARHYIAVATKAVTLYSCARDRALKISSKVHDYVRIGYEPPIFLCDGIDTVSATRVKLDLLGHGYFAAAKPLIADLKKLLWKDLKPAHRGLIALPDTDTPEYWVLQAK